MKTYLISLLLSCVFFSAMAQQPAASDSASSKLYLGIELSTISYGMQNYATMVGGNFTPIVHLNAGYRLTKRINLQVGLTYGREKESGLSGIYYGYGDTIIYDHRSWNNYGIAVPLTIQYTPFNPAKRWNLYATVSLIPVIGEVNHQTTKTFEGETKITYKGHDSGIYLLGTAGVVLNYKISKRFEAYGKVNLFYKDIGHNSYYAQRAKSIGLGLNYNLY
ncbi:outer membrane beta-barrel protein [Pontibacter harenae]|uniref:outer membrane beta-barrel protein n=1 Tax=Pontibacter harenae TaxID=2894083 RepID=UPI001E37D2BB|nr:outer membrane beta-barrel protein [Pontibacter harenae]MCC9165294.1 porin family protein [Pontibacter harenae]